MGNSAVQGSAHEHTVKSYNGDDINMAGYRNKVLLVVNVASGFTSVNYTELQELYGKYKESGFEILGFPCNQFGGQEPGDDISIFDNARAMGATFPIMKKIDVNGDHAIPLYNFLRQAAPGVLGFQNIHWNFTKFLIDHNGHVLHRYAPHQSPKTFENDLQRALEYLKTGVATSAESTAVDNGPAHK